MIQGVTCVGIPGAVSWTCRCVHGACKDRSMAIADHYIIIIITLLTSRSD